MSENKLISYGGGVNSTAMIIMLLNQGFRYPVVFADTGSEQPETYLYITYFQNFLKKKNAEIITLHPSTHPHLYSKSIQALQAQSLEDVCIKKMIVPFLGFRWCTYDWKRDPARRWGKERGIFTHIIGIAADEKQRGKKTNDGRYSYEYPLIDTDIDRADCIRIIKEAGLEPPRKSGCFFCPYQKLSEWKRLKDKNPELFNRGIHMEENASRAAGRKVTMRPDDFSLSEMAEIWNQENPLFPELQSYDHMSCYMCQN